MVHQKKSGLRRWELALLLGMAVSLLAGAWLSGQSEALSARVVRLHVIGASNSPEDQAVKLKVRDAVLAQVGPWLEGASSPEEAKAALSAHLPELARIGAETAGVPVRASLEEDVWFPTREYTDFSLPAGRYTALRLTLGEGEGRNWWCVVFPPLCMGSVTETVAERGDVLTEAQVSLITGESEGYVIKFKALELWNEWTK